MTRTSNQLKIGGHLKTDEGVHFVAVSARAAGYNIMQIMLGPDRSYEPYSLSDVQINNYKQLCYALETYVHMPFMINPCESSPQRRGFYTKTFLQFGRLASMIGAKALVVHPGFKKDLTEIQAYRNLYSFFEKMDHEDLRLNILLEVDSGSKNGSAIGSEEFITEFLREADDPRYGMVIDTAHLYGRGINLWEDKTRQDLIARCGHHIKLVHLNVPDMEVGLGSFKDRHNTPFEERKDMQHDAFLKDWLQFPCILERKSFAVQMKDMEYIAKLTEPAVEKIS